MIAGKYRSMMVQLKNVSTKRDQASMAISASQFGNEGAGTHLAGRRKDLLRRSLLHYDPMIHEDHAVGSIPRQPQLMADHQHRHTTARELPHHVAGACH